MKTVILYTSQEDWVQPLAADPRAFQIQITGKPAFSGRADCVLLSQQHAGNELIGLLGQLRDLRIPCAVVTYDGTLDNQEALLRYGADDVFVLPLHHELLRRRIISLMDIPVHTDAEVNFAAFDRIAEANKGPGSFIVAEHDFMSIYRFVLRLLERLHQSAQLILFRFTSDGGPFLETENVLHFVDVVQTCLRRGDISSVYGNQVVVFLIGSDSAGGQQVINRVISAFNAHYNTDEMCRISYEMREISSP